MVNIKTTKLLKKFPGFFNRNEGIALTSIIVIMVLMSVMGGIFTSIMGTWKVSAPLTINSNKAYYLADTATMFALQDAKYRFFSMNASGTPLFPAATTGIRSAPYVVSSSTTERAEYWIERPYLAGSSPHSTNSDVDLDRGNNDDDTALADDDIVDDDGDDATIINNVTDVSNPLDGFSDVYTIIATGKVIRGGTTVSQRQIKTKVTIIPSPGTAVQPGVQTSGGIAGTGGGFGMTNDDGSIVTSFGTPGVDNNTGPDPETGIVIRPAQLLDVDFVKVIAIDQGHYNAWDLTIDNANDDYPEPSNPSYYIDAPTNAMPNFTYVENDLTVGSNRKGWGCSG
ncbi:ornithine carbamoyltransferase [Candidatus Scalindua japonica]|uniref:Ornithine carbamoyltransferase n=1 Tax=Candidatus Scalindua japonica TaxID=1284222 RepID=A0A286TYW7_9BACT|nr:hypothetical protein [Candidatus Scalindua japonica]GAX61082.1 ornithine carbamoyltransferase [Candidatus Scalindua japonica]